MVKIKKIHFLYCFFKNSYDKIIEIDPNYDYWGWKKKTDLLEKLNRYDEAINWFYLKYKYYFYLIFS